MDLSNFSDVLHTVAQGVLYPVIIVLLLLVAYTVFSIGSVLVERIVERRHFKVAIPAFLRSLEEASAKEMPEVVKSSGMLLRQKRALITLFKNRDLPEEGRWALAKKLLLEEAAHYQTIVSRNETVAKIAPMFGLMGTLIPLGPGLIALGNNDIVTLSDSLLIAFDTTVAGLIAATICYIIARVRKKWYAAYGAALEAGITTMLEKIDLLEKDDALMLDLVVGDVREGADQDEAASPAKSKLLAERAEEV